jgi:hypothetical protein
MEANIFWIMIMVFTGVGLLFVGSVRIQNKLDEQTKILSGILNICDKIEERLDPESDLNMSREEQIEMMKIRALDNARDD